MQSLRHAFCLSDKTIYLNDQPGVAWLGGVTPSTLGFAPPATIEGGSGGA